MGILKDAHGQGTVEAAFVIPIMFMLMLLIIQPGILLYDYIVMRGAAVEACRLAATTGIPGETSSCVEFIENRLAAVPQHECFHVHEGGCSWFIQVDGGEGSDVSEVLIETEVKPLPIFDGAFRLLGLANSNGNLDLSVYWAGSNQPDWVKCSALGGPADWVEAW